jgi:glycosyltransferase involved in cell wall biosynthesis
MSSDPPSGLKKTRIGFVSSHPIQYLAPLYQAVNRTADLEAVPIYLTDFSLRNAVDPLFGTKVVWDVDLSVGTNPLFVPGFETREPCAYSLRDSAPGIWSVVRRAGLDALVIHGHSILANHFASFAARSRSIPVFYQCDAPLAKAQGSLTRRALLRAYYATLSGFLASSTSNRAYYRMLDVPDRKIHHFPFAVDNDRFIKAAALSAGRRALIRQAIGLRDGVPAIVTASKLVAQKRVFDLLDAACALRKEGLDFDVLLIVEGDQRASLERISASAAGPPFVFAGFRNQSEMPVLFAASDIFALPAANENFGLVINEAMCAGLPVVVSSEVGAARDLVHDGENGRIFKAGDITGLSDALRDLLSDADLRQRMGTKSRTIIAGWSYNEDIAGLREALAAVSARR